MDHADPRSQFPASTFSCFSYSPLIFWFLSHRRFSISTKLQQKCSFSEFSEFSVCPGEARTKIRAEPSSNGCAGLLRTKKSELCVHQMVVRTTFGQKSELSVYQMAIQAKVPLHRNSALLVEAHWSVAFSCLGTTPDFGPRPLCVLESCLLLSRTATHGQSPSAGVDVPSLTYSLCWRSHLRREPLAPEALSAQLAVLTCSLKLAQSLASRGLAPEALSAQLAVLTCSLKLA